ncbi:hypothetical protein ACFLSZ_06825 [Candidatus Bipolaricaulota bacterium]
MRARLSVTGADVGSIREPDFSHPAELSYPNLEYGSVNARFVLISKSVVCGSEE